VWARNSYTAVAKSNRLPDSIFTSCARLGENLVSVTSIPVPTNAGPSHRYHWRGQRPVRDNHPSGRTNPLLINNPRCAVISLNFPARRTSRSSGWTAPFIPDSSRRAVRIQSINRQQLGRPVAEAGSGGDVQLRYARFAVPLLGKTRLAALLISRLMRTAILTFHIGRPRVSTRLGQRNSLLRTNSTTRHPRGGAPILADPNSPIFRESSDAERI